MQVLNTDHKFGEGGEYVFVKIDGKVALLTPTAAAIAVQRAVFQPEDVPTIWVRLGNWFRRVFYSATAKVKDSVAAVKAWLSST